MRILLIVIGYVRDFEHAEVAKDRCMIRGIFHGFGEFNDFEFVSIECVNPEGVWRFIIEFLDLSHVRRFWVLDLSELIVKEVDLSRDVPKISTYPDPLLQAHRLLIETTACVNESLHECLNLIKWFSALGMLRRSRISVRKRTCKAVVQKVESEHTWRQIVNEIRRKQFDAVCRKKALLKIVGKLLIKNSKNLENILLRAFV